MPRWLLPAVLALLALASGAVAWQHPADQRADPSGAPPPTVPVLSARRLPGFLSTVVADTRLRSSLQSALDDPGLGGARTRSCLTVQQGRRPIFERNPREPLIPASTLKVLTAHAALTRLGSGERLSTEVRAERPVSPGGVVDGPLWLVGGGDPLLATRDYAASFPNQPQPHTSMEEVADAVMAAGVRHITGGVVGDESRYDTQRYVPTWKTSYITSAHVGPASALVVNDGFAELRAGRIAAAEPDVHAAAVLTGLLQARGVVVGAPPGQGSVASTALSLGRVPSLPMDAIAGEMLRESDNLTAELLTKELGRRFTGYGTTDAGVRVIRETLAAAGLPVSGLVTVDGSGLDRSNRVSCELLMAVHHATGPASALASGFPVAGKDGTLAQRFRGNPAAGRLRAKTGALEGVAGLTGHVGALVVDQGLVFALLANELPSEATGRALQERVGALLARYPDAPAPDTLQP